ncbi:MAG TPA: S41 family peptidase [Candidatus Acidoferrales bacterium]|nr:S41 family peptidase [Candidatus Acidoferrales bacterium]
MKIVRAVLCLLLGSFLAAAASAKIIQIPRHPDYHNGKIAFSYLGDIWVVNEDGSSPRRLTVHPAHDIFPRFSPDGKWIAFSSNRYGNYDVFVIPADGGEPKQLTYHSANDLVVGWSRDSRRVIFSSARGLLYPGVSNLYEVSIEGGLEQPMATDWGSSASYSPDAKKLAFNRHGVTWWRKHYRGSNAADLWVMDFEKKTYRKLLDEDVPDRQKANNLWPMYGNGEIFFVSDREVTATAGEREVLRSTNNIWKIPDTGGKPVQVTHHKDGSLFYPSISGDGKVIVYEENFGLWKLDTATGKTIEVKIAISSDDKENNFQALTVNGEADQYDLSPSTRRAVISTHGEIFTIATERGDVGRVTSSYWRDVRPVWSPDGKWIAYVSDQPGSHASGAPQDDVWVGDTEGKNVRKLTDAATEKLDLEWAPDSKALLYAASDHKLYWLELEAAKQRVLAINDAGNISGAAVSPDGKWVAYAKPDRDLRSHVYIVSSSGGDEHVLGDARLFSSSAPRWTPDGKKLVFLGGFVQGGSATLRENLAALYSVSLAREEKDPMSRDVDDEEAARAAERANPERGAMRGGAGQEARPVEVKIDFDGMQRRIHQVTRLSENVVSAVPSPDGRSYAFVTTSEGEGRPVFSLYLIQENGEQMRRLTQSQPPSAEEEGPAAFGGGAITAVKFSRDARTIYFHEANAIWSVPAGPAQEGAAGAERRGGETSAGGRRKVNFTLRVEVDNKEERSQVFNEAWRVMKNRFYDAQMNGVDWARMRAVYEPLLADVADREELQSIIAQMIGELNASHTGISGGGEPDRNAIRTRFPGFELVADSSGFYKVAHIYKDGPADHDYVRIHSGDFVLAVNGAPLRAGDNYWKNYNLAPGRKFEFTVNSKPAAEGAWVTRVTPVSAGAYATLQYEKWVEDRRQMVEKLSGGEIGYLHIRQMNAAALRKFERDLADNRFKKALVIDQRFNPGGGIDQELLEILQQHQYQYTRGRDSVYVTRPQRAYFGPVVVMQNERSFSDAEVFPDGFRTLKLGKTVGVSTNGSVIGTGAFRLMDGSSVRTPGTGLWNVSGQNLENFGVPADVRVDNTPADYFAGRDAQLEKAVEVLKEELHKNPPPVVPGR